MREEWKLGISVHPLSGRDVFDSRGFDIIYARTFVAIRISNLARKFREKFRELFCIPFVNAVLLVRCKFELCFGKQPFMNYAENIRSYRFCEKY